MELHCRTNYCLQYIRSNRSYLKIMNLLNKILGGCIIASSFFSCTEQETKEVKATNFPNKDSELAIMMRDIVENTQKVKEQIINGKEVEFFIEFEKR